MQETFEPILTVADEEAGLSAFRHSCGNLPKRKGEFADEKHEAPEVIADVAEREPRRML